MHLATDLFRTKNLEQAPTRDGYGQGLVEAGKANPNVVVLCADLSESTRSLAFKQAFPDRFIQMGVSEQCLPSIAAGLALSGKVPFISSYAAFSPGRNWEQIKTCVALQNMNVKIAGAHAGINVGPDGATHQMLEDIALMRVVPNMRVLIPCDRIQTRNVTIAAAEYEGPVYFRFTREKSPVFTTDQTPFQMGKADVYRFGTDATIVAAGPLLYEALLAAESLSKKQKLEVRVINLHTMKPLDIQTLILAAKETGAIVTVEEAQAAGGLGGAVCEALASTVPVPIERIGAQDRFGESGEPSELADAMGLSAHFIALAAVRAWKRKKKQRVVEIPEYLTEANKTAEKMRQKILDKAMKEMPKEWNS